MRIMTANIWGDYFGNAVSAREDDMFKVFDEYKPDVIGMQEVTPNWYAGSLFKNLSGEYNFSGTEIYNSANYVPLAYRKGLKLLAKGNEPVAVEAGVTKELTWAVLEREDSKVFGVVNAHYWYMKRGDVDNLLRDKNALQSVELIKYINGRFHCPVFIFGDLNCTMSSSVFTSIFASANVKHAYDLAKVKDDIKSHHGNPVVDENGKYHGKTTDLDHTHSIDHIMAYGNGYEIKAFKVITDQNALDASDHSPVYADVELL